MAYKKLVLVPDKTRGSEECEEFYGAQRIIFIFINSGGRICVGTCGGVHDG